MLPERDTIRRIREAVADGRLGKTFRAAEVNRVLKIEFAGYSCRSIALAIRVASRNYSFELTQAFTG